MWLDRDFVNACWSRGNNGWDQDLHSHAMVSQPTAQPTRNQSILQVLAASHRYLYQTICALPECEWCWVRYEEFCACVEGGGCEGSPLVQQLSEFLEVSASEISLGLKGFRPSNKSARDHMDSSDLRTIEQLAASLRQPASENHLSQWVLKYGSTKPDRGENSTARNRFSGEVIASVDMYRKKTLEMQQLQLNNLLMCLLNNQP